MEKKNLEQPKRIAPELTEEQRAALAPVDLMVQYVIPKLIDKLNMLEYNTNVALSELHETIATLQEQANKPRKAGRKKSDAPKEAKAAARSLDMLPSGPRPVGVTADIKTPVNISRLAKYDMDKDCWIPRVISGVEITAEVVNAVKAGQGSYTPDVVAFVYELTDDETLVLQDLFSA